MTLPVRSAVGFAGASARTALLSMSIAAIGLLTGCSNDPAEAAKLDFSQAHTCPAARIAVTPVTDVTMPELMLGPNLGITAEVRDDPERLALWKRQNAPMLTLFGYYKVFHAEGCGHEADYGCRCPRLGESSHVSIRSKSLRTMCTCTVAPRSVRDVRQQRRKAP